MKKLFVLVAVALLIAAVSCDTKNVGGNLPTWGPIITGVNFPAAMNGAADATWTVSFTSGTAPYTISMNLGGGATNNVPAGTPAVSPFTQVFTMVNASTTDNATYTYTVTVTDSRGFSGTATGSFTVGPMLNQAPVIDSAIYTEGTRTLAVTVSDPDDGETLTVNIAGVDAPISVDAASKAAAATGPLVANFVFSSSDPFADASDSVDVTVNDGDADSAVTAVTITVPGIVLAADTLYAIPLNTSVATGENCLVVVATGDPANPFQYVNGVGLTIASDADKTDSFNIGVPGGGAGDVDGFWTTMNPGGGFLLPPFNFIVATDIGGGLERWDFNVTPIGGADVAAGEGALFNFTFTFGSAGTKTFGFQEVSGVKRTYYSDGASTEYFWGDITNATAPTVSVN